MGGITKSLDTSSAIDLCRIGASSRISGVGRMQPRKRRRWCGRFPSSSGDSAIGLRCLTVGNGLTEGGGLRVYHLRT
jgi:hypothetical protein